MHDKATITMMFLGDIVGTPGLTAVSRALNDLRNEYHPDIIIVNAENSAPDGRGLTPAIAEQLYQSGVHGITTGNHVWAKKEIIPYIANEKRLVRPANFPGGCPGVGATVILLESGIKVGVLNLMGRVFMHEQLDCPFRTAQAAVQYLRHQTPLILVDMHAETTAEKCALAAYLDGTVTAVIGTHTHVQTADERILPKGSAFLTDAGMCGPMDSSLGMAKEAIIQRFLTQMPQKFTVATTGELIISGVVVVADRTTGMATTIRRIQKKAMS